MRTLFALGMVLVGLLVAWWGNREARSAADQGCTGSAMGGLTLLFGGAVLLFVGFNMLGEV